MRLESTEELSEEYGLFLKHNGLPERCALEQQGDPRLTDHQRRYLELFCDRWDVAQDREDAEYQRTRAKAAT